MRKQLQAVHHNFYICLLLNPELYRNISIPIAYFRTRTMTTRRIIPMRGMLLSILFQTPLCEKLCGVTLLL